METKKLREAGTSARLDLLYRPNPGCQPPSNPLREILHKVPRAVMPANCHVSATTAKPDVVLAHLPGESTHHILHFPHVDVSRFDPINRARTFVP